ncbi:MFS transporter [Nocardioides sp. SYSU DS0663]|uniref:MFS transporter n=1 Tax=Nocardioides sp. SYSU DS0663 TaxID=3416445 RepID=UPI003F4C739D
MRPDEPAASGAGHERGAVVGAVACYSLALSVASVAVPILLVRAGYSTAQVGFLIALSALAQIATRFRVGALLRRVADKHLVGAASVLMALGSGVLVVSDAVWVIVGSQLVQGASRGLFWTGIQTHAVRGPASAARGLASVNLASGTGLVLGPVLAGVLLERSAGLALAAGALAAAVAVLPVAVMATLPVFPPSAAPAGDRVARRPAVRAGAWAAASAGGWRGLMGAYVPVALDAAAYTGSTIGAVVAITNGATVAAGWSARWLPAARFPAGLAAGVLATGLGLAAFGATAGSLLVAAAASLVVSGLAMGLLQTIGPAFAAESVDEADRGDAMAAVGLYRSGATFLAPLAVGALVLAVPLSWALVAAGLALAVPAASARGARAVPAARPR